MFVPPNHMHTCQEQSKPKENPTDFTIFKDPDHKTLLFDTVDDSASLFPLDQQLEEAPLDDSLYAEYNDSLEQLLMFTSLSEKKLNELTTANLKPTPASMPENIDFQFDWGHDSLTNLPPDAHDPYLADSDSIYQMHDLDEHNSLHDYSSISNIIYTGKMKEELRRKRNRSIDIGSTLSKKSASKVSKSSLKSNKPVSTSTGHPKPNFRRSKSLGTICLSTKFSLYSKLPSPQRHGSSPNSKATNPFYQPPAILKRLSHSE